MSGKTLPSSDGVLFQVPGSARAMEELNIFLVNGVVDSLIPDPHIPDVWG